MSRTRRPIRLAAVTALFAAATLGLPSTPAQAQATHVAFYVAGVGTACTSVGANSLTDLESKYDVTIGPAGRPTAGMVLFIDGHGSNSNNPDYWSYWHWSSNRWAYAGSGPSAYHPVAGQSEGWAFGTYKSTDQPPLPSANYASLCGGGDPIAVPIHSNPAPPPPKHPSTHATKRPPVNASPSRTASSPANPTTRASLSGPRSPTATPDVSASPTTASAPPVSVPGAASSSTSALPIAPPKAAPAKRSGLPTWGTALALVAVAALGGVAVWRARVQRHNQL